uniref:Uncharacterized protein n=1 Tax=Arundo donax TaxID=35708 RepID=A0A0A9T7M3_ARUDO
MKEQSSISSTQLSPQC